MDTTTLHMMQLGKKGYTCSQILVQMGLELRGEDNPALVRAMTGLAYGCGAGAGTCGALTGGCCLIALFAGKGSDEEQASDRILLMLTELSDWFSEQVGQQYGGMECQAIVGDEGPSASAIRCGDIVVRTYGKVLEILAANGIELV
ncbi:MAG: C-GCAxxG-C-C family protein [Pseudomonadota bacterium]